ncbi:MAG: hypothetical protein RLZZ568_1252 [Cyanobacteriota bacterium]
MSIQEIVTQILQQGYLTPAIEAEVGRIYENATELTTEEYNALGRLMAALRNGEVVAMSHKQFINVMEEMVATEAVVQVSQCRHTSDEQLDIADIAAYALNRLPPLYATSEEGANYQRQRAHDELASLIRQQVTEGINRYLDRPQLGDRKPLDKPVKKNLLSRVSTLLETFAPD